MKILKLPSLLFVMICYACGPTDEELMTQARELMVNGRIKEAQKILDGVIEKTPDHQAAHNMRGIARLELDETALAIEDFDTSIRLDSTDYRAFYNRGNAYYQVQEYSEAILDYDRAMRLEPKSADIYINRANALVQLENYVEAIQDYQFAIKLEETNYLTHFNLGRTYYIGQEQDKAKICFEKCISIYETYAPAYYFLGMIALETDEPEASCIYWKQAADLGYLQADEVLELYCTPN
jgi:tetratricopeptide (TPR) repeat protein